MNCVNEITELLQLSARLGRDPRQVQASSGNTSLKIDGVMWIKASGKWLAHAADENILVPIDLADVHVRFRRGEEILSPATGKDGDLQPSIETAMHAVLQNRVVIHTHSVSTLAWAVRKDGQERLAERLSGLCWQWIPYLPSGIPLARAIESALESSPCTTVFVLANHGLVVCGESCDSAERLLLKVEALLEVPPRSPDTREQLATDATSLRILEAGFLYPCQAIFLGTTQDPETPPFFLNRGRLVVNDEITPTQFAVLVGLLEVVRRIPETAPLRYLSEPELAALLTEDSHCYKQRACLPDEYHGSALHADQRK